MNNYINRGTLETTTPAGKVSRLISAHATQYLPGQRALDPFIGAVPIWQQASEQINSSLSIDLSIRRDRVTGLYPTLGMVVA